MSLANTARITVRTVCLLLYLDFCKSKKKEQPGCIKNYIAVYIDEKLFSLRNGAFG